MDNTALECPVCLDIFVDPRTLKCNHTLCFKCAKQLSQLNPKQVTCPVCRKVTRVKTTIEKDLTPNFALVPIIDAHIRSLSIATTSTVASVTTAPLAAPSALATAHTTSVIPSGQPIVSPDHLHARLQQLFETSSHLTAALAHLPATAAIQRTQVVTQFDMLRQAVDTNQAATLENLTTLEKTVAAQLQEQLNVCAQHTAEVQRMLDTYPGSMLTADVDQWLEAEDSWKSKISVMQQFGVLGAFTANVPVSIPESSISYEGHSVDFPSLWAISRDPNFLKTNRGPKPAKPIHFITQSASSVLRRWNFRDRVTITEMNHPGLRSWSLFEKGSKIAAASAKIKVFDAFTGECLSTFESLSSPAKRIIAGGSELKARAISFHVNQGAAALWDLSQNCRLSWEMDISHWNTGLVTQVAVDSPLLLVPTISFPFDVLFFSILTGDYEAGRKLEGFQTDVVDVVPFGNGKYCVCLCASGALTMWDLEQQKVLKSVMVDSKHSRISLMKLHKSEIGKVLPTVATYSLLSGAFSIYHPMTERLQIITHNSSALLTSSMRSVLICKGGQRALSGHANGRVHVWDLTTGHCLETLAFGITGNFAECNRGHNVLVGTPNGYLNIVDLDTLAVQSVLPSVIDGSGILVHRIGDLFRG